MYGERTILKSPKYENFVENEEQPYVKEINDQIDIPHVDKLIKDAYDLAMFDAN